MKHFYERNNKLLESDVNKTFEEILWMTDSEFREWLYDLRKTVVKIWDEDGIPPRVGLNEEEIIEQFNKLESFPVNTFLVEDEYTKTKDVIRNTRIEGNAVNQWFPTMMKTKITYSSLDKAKSIYDYFADDSLYESQLTYSKRHFKRDSFYHYSKVVKYNDSENSLINAKSAIEWIKKFENIFREQNEFDYWLEPRSEDNNYTGYNLNLDVSNYLYITRNDIEKLGNLIPDKCKTNLDYKKDKFDSCRIRWFKYGQKIFPIGLKAFRISYCQSAVNFPPLTAKFIYERYTKPGDNVIVWDPSAGWGGRLLGALSCKSDRDIFYVGTDPNTDHRIENGKTKYDDIIEFYNTKTVRSNCLFPHTNDGIVYQCGSEVFKDTEHYKQYEGKVSIVFTSPPYFSKEVYSEDDEQSCNKFQDYISWRDNFLKPTLETAYNILHSGGYLVWNIADIELSGETLPLEKDSCKIIENLGFKYVETLKLALAQMPGGNRINVETGLPTAKNFCKVKGLWLRYEPIFVYIKE